MTDEQFKARLIAAVERIAVANELMVAPPQTPAPETECQHPDEARISFGITRGQPDWQCGLCAYRPEIANG